MTIWPAIVPVSVEFWPGRQQGDGEDDAGQAHPQHRREQLERVLACPPHRCARCVWKVAAATIRIAALMKSANIRARKASIEAKRTASHFPRAVCS